MIINNVFSENILQNVLPGRGKVVYLPITIKQKRKTMKNQINVNWDKYGYKWIPIEEKESFVKQVWSKTRWSHEKCASLLSDADGYELIPVYGLDWWIDFIKRTSKQF